MTGDGVPRYRQIAGDLRDRIASGEFPVGSKLPPVAELKDRYQAANNTIAAAVAVLRRQGMVATYQGSGMFVTSAEPAPGSSVLERLEALEAWRREHEEGHGR